MKSKIIKLIIIFFLIISMFRTGMISSTLNDVNLFLFGFTFFVYIIMAILFVLLLFLKDSVQRYLRKYLIALLLVVISVELILTLVRINIILGSTGSFNEFFIQQSLFDPKNIHDQVGLIQTFFVVSLRSLFGDVGIYVISLIIFSVAVFLILDIDYVLKTFIKFIKNMFTKDDDLDDNYNDYDISSTIKLGEAEKEKSKNNSKKSSKKDKKGLKPVKEPKKETTEKESGEEEKKNKISRLKGDSVKEENMFNIPKSIGNKNIEENFAENRYKKDTNKEPVKETEKKSTEKESALKIDVIDLKNNKSYKIPPITLLKEISNNEETKKRIEKRAKEKGKILLDTLESFKVKAALINIIVGSSITRYELRPETGQKVNKFLNLNNDLAMALAAKSIRIEAPIPGKSLVGIEVPNEKRLMVGLKELINRNVSNKTSKLKISLGKDLEGKIQYLDIAKAPHLLVAGATGSGKSVCINGMITNILLTTTPEEVKFLLIDPKKVELTPYNGIPHLLSPVITDPEKATIALNRLVYEMEERYELFASTRTRNIESYNKIQKDNKLPYIVTIIDELADLMMVSGTEVEISISRIAQKARAAGIHLILATQRPSTDVITGLIKSNIPTRISFMVSSSIDSRTILDTSGAEKLLGNGDMLLSNNGSNGLIRIQGAYLSDDEINDVVSFINEQFVDDDMNEFYKEDFINLEVSDKKDLSLEEDSLIYDAIELGLVEKKISTSFLQRRLRIGFNRATNLIEQMEERGWVSKSPGNNKGREILVTLDEVYSQKNNKSIEN